MTKIVTIDCQRISDWDSLHDVFAEAFGFPDYYGRNANAWIDCMTNLDADCSKHGARPGETVALELQAAQLLKERSPQLLADIFEMAAFVNYRRIEAGDLPVLCISGNITGQRLLPTQLQTLRRLAAGRVTLTAPSHTRAAGVGRRELAGSAAALSALPPARRSPVGAVAATPR